jgi:hypothetical protein
MAETPEIPEAKDPFEKRAAVTIAILAVSLAVIGNKGDDTKTEAIIKTNEAANGYAFFQAKSIKGSIASAERDLLASLAPSQTGAADIGKITERLKAKIEKYEKEQEPIKEEADKNKGEAAHELAINKRCDHGELALQIGIVIASVSILARSHIFWIASIILGLIGIGIGVSAFLL